MAVADLNQLDTSGSNTVVVAVAMGAVDDRFPFEPGRVGKLFDLDWIASRNAGSSADEQPRRCTTGYHPCFSTGCTCDQLAGFVL